MGCGCSTSSAENVLIVDSESRDVVAECVGISPVKTVDSESRDVVAECLGISLVVKKILEHCSTSELIKLSLVNKLWNYEARSLMKIRGNLVARISKNGACQDLSAFASDLQQMKEMDKVVPFSGLTIALHECTTWSHGDWCKESSAEELDQVCEDILDKITWKNLAVNVNCSWYECKNCAAYLLVKKIFQKYSCTLEQISLCHTAQREFIRHFLHKGCSFPSLKNLRLRNEYLSQSLRASLFSNDDTILIKKLVSMAPNLQVLYTENRVDLKANLLEGSSAVHVTDYEYRPYYDEIPESVIGELRMQRMRFELGFGDFRVERFNRVTSTLLKNSSTTLSSMDIDAIYLVPLTRYNICSEKVNTLFVRFIKAHLETGPPRLWRLLESFDFKRIFPSLSTVSVVQNLYPQFERTLNAFDDMIEQENAAFIEPMPDRAGNIKNLSLEWNERTWNSSVQLLFRMFPDIQKLSITAGDIPSNGIWDSWLNLTELDFALRLRGSIIAEQQLDSFFCGMFPEEVAQLQKWDAEFLRRVNIVPTMPSLTCLKGLRTLNLSLEGFSFCGRVNDCLPVDNPRVELFKVTYFITLQRLPDLTVSLSTTCPRIKKALSRSMPPASVVLRPRKRC